jgi:UDP-N-acetyl-D-mannosaminuronate dehydrogenase
MLFEKLMENKIIGLWGTGYLAYTFMLKLQSKGFQVKLFDFSQFGLDELKSKQYPTKDQIHCWSETGTVPSIDFDKIIFADSEKEMFQDVNCHVIAFPAQYSGDRYNTNLFRLRDCFETHLETESLVLFQSASGPGSLNRDFLSGFKKKRDLIKVATAFRSDWTLEEFLSGECELSVASVNDTDKVKAIEVLHLLGFKTRELSRIRSAELLENARHGLEFTINSYLNQLAMAYPTVDFGELLPPLLNNLKLDKCKLGVGTGGYRLNHAIENLISESDYGENLTLLKESGSSNLSSMLCFAELFARSGCGSVAILGLSHYQDLYLSPALIIADAMIQNGIDVFLHDPFYSEKNTHPLIPNANWLNWAEGLKSVEGVLLLTSHPFYSLLSQKFVEKVFNGELSLIVDNCGAWQHLDFPEGIRYSQVGDGTLNVFG